MMNIALLPLSAIFAAVAFCRRTLYRSGILRSITAAAPVVVVGNIVAGGGGKTPIVIALTVALRQRGMNPGVVVRPVGASAHRQGKKSNIIRVRHDSDWRQCGDEALLIHQRTGAPVSVSKKRGLAAQQLASDGCDIVICDDGLQHSALNRNLEICAIQGDFGIGNGWLLPAGPLRESPRRLRQCDWLAIHGDAHTADDFAARYGLPNRVQWAAITTVSDGFYAPSAPQQIISAKDFARQYNDKKIAALAGIAAPNRFFSALRKLGICLHRIYPLPDHKRMPPDDFAAIAADIIIMTEKDAVKYPSADQRIRVLRIHAEVPPNLTDAAAKLARGR